MRRVDAGPSLIFAADATTAVAAAFNAAWLAGHWLRYEHRGRRLAAATLAALNAGIALQAAFAQALYAAHRLGASTAPFFATAPWFASRAPLLAGTLLLSTLILRRVR
jgi:hypothetical protein